MFGAIVKSIKILGKAKASLEAVDDDVDLDGKRELDELKECFDNLVHLGKEVVAELKKGWSIAAALIDHVAKAGLE